LFALHNLFTHFLCTTSSRSLFACVADSQQPLGNGVNFTRR